MVCGAHRLAQTGFTAAGGRTPTGSPHPAPALTRGSGLCLGLTSGLSCRTIAAASGVLPPMAQISLVPLPWATPKNALAQADPAVSVLRGEEFLLHAQVCMHKILFSPEHGRCQA